MNNEDKLKNAGGEASAALSAAPTMIIYIALLHPGDNMCGTSNQLILDSITTTYMLKDGDTSKLNGKAFPLTLGVGSIYRSINAVNSDKLLEFQIQVGTVENPMSYCDDTPYGFKLSEIMYNLGNVEELEPNKTNNVTIPISNGWKDIAHLVFVQRAFAINKCGCNYVVFSFLIRNVGTSKARKVLFKDILPEGITLLPNGVYIKDRGSRVHNLPSKNYKLVGRRVLASLSDIEEDEEVVLILACSINKSMCVFNTNVGAISYLGYQAVMLSTKGPQSPSMTKSKSLILTQLSNIKKVSKF